jgi:hypothetical protein
MLQETQPICCNKTDVANNSNHLLQQDRCYKQLKSSAATRPMLQETQPICYNKTDASNKLKLSAATRPMSQATQTANRHQSDALEEYLNL